MYILLHADASGDIPVKSWCRHLQPLPPRPLSEFRAGPLHGQMGAICVAGDIEPFVESPDYAELFHDRGIIQLGPTSPVIFRNARVRALVGYRPELSIALPAEGAAGFREAILAAPRALSRGSSFRMCLEEQRLAWGKLIRATDGTAGSNSDLAWAASRNLESLFTMGDLDWSLGQAARFITVDTPSQRLSMASSPIIEVVNVTRNVIGWLREEPTRLAQLSPAAFENIILDRLEAMRFVTHRIGHTYQRDGGIDILAWPQKSAFPFLLAVQAKHSRSERVIGPEPVRALRGVLSMQPIDVGMLVTNTRFSADARWVAQQRPTLLRLRDFEDLKAWLLDHFEGESAWRDIPDSIEVAPGISIPIPRR